LTLQPLVIDRESSGWSSQGAQGDFFAVQSLEETIEVHALVVPDLDRLVGILR